MIKSPLRYPGGKSRAVQYLKLLLPEFDEMREVFFGGGSLGFYCSQKFENVAFSASDLNYELYCFWSQLKDNNDQLIEGIQHIYDEFKVAHAEREGKLLFRMLVDRRNNYLSELERGIDFFILNRITFSGVVDSGGYSQGSFEARFTQSSINRLKDAVAVINRFTLYCDNYNFLIDQPGNNVFLFLDPPYYSATKSKLYGKKGILHTQFDHLHLFRSLKNCKHKWLITYDNCEFIRNLYAEYNQVQWQLQYGMTTRNNSTLKGNELVIANYDLQSVQETNTKKHQSILWENNLTTIEQFSY